MRNMHVCHEWRIAAVRRTFAMTMAAGVLLFAGCAAPVAPVAQQSQAELDAMKRVRFEDTPDGARAILDNSVLFKFGTAEFDTAAAPVLDVLKPVFNRARGQIIIEGHTDSVGGVASNQKLSLQRAERVRDEVVKRQFSPDRLVAKGFGATKPRRSPEVTDDDRRQNRRAEFLFPNETVASLDGKKIEQEVNSLAVIQNMLGDGVKKVGAFFDNLRGGQQGSAETSSK